MPVATQEAAQAAAPVLTGTAVKVRFAPSPTGNLHVGGARTALFNWLYAKRMGGKFIIRVEDTDTARSTRESEEAMIRDLKWLGLDWDEGPDVGGPCAPYRQSERTDIYKEYVQKLVADGLAYPCFCTDEELEQMKKEAEELKVPPIYRGKWASASQAEVDEMTAKGVPFCYRFRVPKGQEVTIQDIVRGEVSWSTDTLGDFVLLRSSGLPVYNFCVAVDDALMGVTHVLRAEEHLPNTLRQVLIYNALGWKTPQFGHMSLILAPDKSKLSKRHGATSVGEFKQQGYLAPAMINYLSLLGWNDGTEKEIFTVEELQQTFSLERITKSAAVFDKVKLGWMNGQHLRALPAAQVEALVGQQLAREGGPLRSADTPFAKAAVNIVKNSLEVLSSADDELRAVLSYPLEATLASDDFKPIGEDGFGDIVAAVLAAADSGELEKGVKEQGHGYFKDFAKALGKAQKRKGKRLFMPLRVALTGRMQGPDIGDVLALLVLEDGDVTDESAIVSLTQRLDRLRTWAAAQ